MSKVTLTIAMLAAVLGADVARASPQELRPGQWEAISTDLGAKGGHRTTTTAAASLPAIASPLLSAIRRVMVAEQRAQR